MRFFIARYITITRMLPFSNWEKAHTTTNRQPFFDHIKKVNCIYKVIYNLYHCRLSEIPQVVFASELEEDEYTDEEIERMRLRPGIERALDVEHRKALRKVGIEMNKIQVSQKKGGLQRAGNARR